VPSCSAKALVRLADVGSPQGGRREDADEPLLACVMIEDFRYRLRKVFGERGGEKTPLRRVGHQAGSGQLGGHIVPEPSTGIPMEVLHFLFSHLAPLAAKGARL
jgi:hypothetical protein